MVPGRSSAASCMAVAPLDDQGGAVGEREGPGGHQGGVLTQAVAGAGARGESQALHGVEHDQARHEGGELGVGREGELLHGGVEEQGGQVASGDLGGLARHLPRGVVHPGPAHAGPLGPLSREGKGQHPRAPLGSDRYSTRPVDGPVCHGRDRTGGSPHPPSGARMVGGPEGSRLRSGHGRRVGSPEKPPQGWFADPFGVHEARWFSQGRATALVRDGRKEAQDPPPGPVVDQPLIPAAVASAVVPPPRTCCGRASRTWTYRARQPVRLLRQSGVARNDRSPHHGGPDG